MHRAESVAHAAGLAMLFAMAGCGEVLRLGDGACQKGQVAAGEVLWIGDSWVTTPGNQVTHVQDLARAAGAIGPNDLYVNRGIVGAAIATIAGQYNIQESGPIKVRVLILDGGGIDLIQSGVSDAVVANVVSTFTQLLATVASDGTVQQVIYFLVPEVAAIPGISTALRPGMKQACEASAVPCYFLDLQPFFTGHPEYVDGIQATDAGAVVQGDAIWNVMQQNCIAQ